MSSTAIPQPATRRLPLIRTLADRVANAWWLIRRVIQVRPGFARLWIAASLLGGLIVPAMLWAANGTANNLQDRLDGGAGSNLWWYAAAWVVLLGINLLAEQAEGIFSTYAREYGGATIAGDALEKATRIDLAAYEDEAFYNRMALVLTDAEQSANDALHQFALIAWAVPRVISWAAVLVVFDWRLALIAVVPMPPAVWAWFLSGTLYWNIYREQTRERRLADYYAGLLTSRQAAKEVRLFGLAEPFIDRWSRAYWAAARQVRNQGLRTAFRQRGISALSTSLLLLGFAAYVAWAEFSASAGTAVVVVSSYTLLYGGILGLGTPIQELGRIAGFARNLREFLAMPDEGAGRDSGTLPDIVNGELQLESVSFAYPGTDTPVIDDLSITIHAGETVALVGENGAGKTTLVKLLLGLYQPESGRILLDGRDLASIAPAELRAHLSGVFQHFVQYPMSVRDNIATGADVPEREVARVLDLAGLPRLPAQLPEGLATMLAPDLGGVDLSGGQWQRLAIARAGIRPARVIALDEPTAALDPLAEVAIFRRFAELARHRTTVLVSHRLGMARLADRILVLEHGRIMEQGTHDELAAKPDSEYRRMWQAQSRWYQ